MIGRRIVSIPEKVLSLVDVFERNAEAYQSAHFKEAELRQQFVNPLFKCLGWDMDNEQGNAENYKDVVHEAAIRIGGATKAPDYSFRIGGRPIFYLEAKKPAADREGRYASNNFFIVFPTQECGLTLSGLCALLNSPFMTWYFRAIEPRRGRVFAELKIKHLAAFPLPGAILTGLDCQTLNRLGEQRAEVAAKLASAKAPHDKTVLQAQIDATDRQIDRLVYVLYRLTEEEIGIVEGDAK
jgi:hypothetical protein